MAVIGMLRRKKKVHKNKQAISNALVAQSQGHRFFYFNPDGIDFDRKKIHGHEYDGYKWNENLFDFPDVVINDFPRRDPEIRAIYKRLKKDVPFTAHSEGSKVKVYNKVKAAGEFNDYLIPSDELKNPEMVIDYLEEFNQVIIKPIKGNQGRDVFFFAKEDEDSYTFYDYMDQLSLNKKGVLKLVEGKTAEESYLVQPYIDSRTAEGHPCDYRTVMQKNGEGKWVINFFFSRVSPGSGINCSRSRGAAVADMKKVLTDKFGEQECKKIMKNVKQFSRQFAAHMDELYDHPFDELAFDIGIDQNGRIWLYEANTFPGTEFKELERALNIIPYAAYLAAQNDTKHSKPGDHSGKKGLLARMTK
ncbi:YheC/YheD family protein [Alteribacter natronophilus]|uniref:YheC/YheD family protein n=1 Tax=Alteribacter natronophilus TaxID=2583810 RepID=UPI00110F1D18|nr:YheC/YheD family protein [Alteribacter natronophilus]TMW72344.1 hypothetical protein FGB90_09060 [Alteribacter natronophilus]